MNKPQPTREWLRRQKASEAKVERKEVFTVPKLSDLEQEQLAAALKSKVSLQSHLRSHFKVPVVVSVQKADNAWCFEVRGCGQLYSTWDGIEIKYINCVNVGLNGIHG